VLRLLEKQIGNAQEVRDIDATAKEVAIRWVNPLSGGQEETNGLVWFKVEKRAFSLSQLQLEPMKGITR
jgi:hypothetical protein